MGKAITCENVGRTGACGEEQRKNGERRRDMIVELFRVHREKGLPVPTNMEMRKATGLSSSCTIHNHLKTLVKQGKLAQHTGKFGHYYLLESGDGQG